MRCFLGYELAPSGPDPWEDAINWPGGHLAIDDGYICEDLRASFSMPR